MQKQTFTTQVYMVFEITLN